MPGEPMALPQSIVIREVSPRDGLQAEAAILPTAVKLELIEGLIRAGIRRIEAASFVSPKWLPQMADAEAVMKAVPRVPGVRYSVLVPNMPGAERAVDVRPDEMTVFVSASETHNRKNVNRTIAQSLAQFSDIVRLAGSLGIEVSAVVVTAFGCPYEGKVPLAAIEGLLDRIQRIGIRQVTLGDTVGCANPRQVFDTVKRLQQQFPSMDLGLHFHDNRGTALANALAAMLAGARYFDTALGGIGGSPFSPGAGGNLATEDLVYCAQEMGVGTGVDVMSLVGLGDRLAAWIGHDIPSRVHQARGPMIPVGIGPSR